MRLTVTLTDLTPDEWLLAQEILQAEYEISPNAGRVCLTITHLAEERHVELPAGKFVGFMGLMTMEPLFREFRKFATAMAALTPDALPDVPEADK